MGRGGSLSDGIITNLHPAVPETSNLGGIDRGFDLSIQELVLRKWEVEWDHKLKPIFSAWLMRWAARGGT
jgi:hypothetical protein